MLFKNQPYYFGFLLFVLLCGNLLAGYAQQVASDAPVAWFRFDEYRYKDGRTAADFTGNIDSAAYQGDAMTVSAGIDDKCGWFNGNQAGVDLGNALGSLLDGASDRKSVV